MILDTILYEHVTLYDFLVVLVTFAVAIIITKIININLRRGLKEKVSKDHLENATKVVTYLIFVIAVIFSLPVVGFDPSGLLLAGGIVGVIIGFASQSTVGNLVSGLLLMVERPIKIGDKVQLEGESGYVESIRIISTTIRTFDGLYIRIPNEKVFTNKITNFVSNVARRFEYNIGIRYSDDADKAIFIIKSLIEEQPLALKKPSPSVFVDSLGDNAVNIITRVWSTPNKWYTVKMDILWKIKSALEKEGIEIAFPQRIIQFGKNEKNIIRSKEDFHSMTEENDQDSALETASS